MHKIIGMVLFIVLVLGSAGCAKKSDLIGKIVDAQGNPLPSIKIIASQKEPVKGYEEFDTLSGLDGSFELKGLFPLSEYVLTPWSNKWKSNAKVEVKTAPEGESLSLSQPFTIRFTASNNGVIGDSLTSLEWVAGPGQDMDWNAANQWVMGLSIAGGKWRMPTYLELKSLYKEDMSTEYKIDPVYNLNACCVWTSDKNNSLTARNFSFKPRVRDLGNLDNSYHNRAFAVRPNR